MVYSSATMLLAMPVYTGLGAGVAELERNKPSGGRKGAATGHDAMHVVPHVPTQRATPRARQSMYALLHSLQTQLLHTKNR